MPQAAYKVPPSAPENEPFSSPAATHKQAMEVIMITVGITTRVPWITALIFAT